MVTRQTYETGDLSNGRHHLCCHYGWPDYTWTVANERLSASQKSFLNYEGCHEHNFVMQKAIHDSRNSKKEVVIACLDLTNVFPSFTTTQFTRSLRHMDFRKKSTDNKITVRLLDDTSKNCHGFHWSYSYSVKFQVGMSIESHNF